MQILLIIVVVALTGLSWRLMQLRVKAGREMSLLQELLHHRVKNNLQIIISLLNTQLRYQSDEAARRALQKTRLRIFSLSLADKQLLDSTVSQDVDLPLYIQELIRNLSDEYETDGSINFRLESVNLRVDAEAARLLGLLLNEALSNAIEHAFPDGAAGEVLVKLEVCMHGWMHLSISDNGVGLPEGWDAEPASSFGMNLIRGMSEQLNGDLDIDGERGVSIQLDLRVPTERGPRRDPRSV